MRDLRERFAELDLLDAPEMRSDVDARIANGRSTAEKLAMPIVAVPWWRGPLIAAGTATAIIIVTGAVLLLLTGDSTSVSDQPVTAPEVTMTTEPSEATELRVEPVLGQGTWQQVAVDESWVASIIDLDPLADGGFVALTAEAGPWSVAWSPNGVDWHQGDPRAVISGLRGDWGQPSGLSNGRDPDHDRMLVVDDRVVLLAEDDATVFVGDPRTGDWKPFLFETTGLSRDLAERAMAANDSEVLVAGIDRAAGAICTWLADPATGKLQRMSPISVEEGFAFHWTPDIDVAHVNGQWLIRTAVQVPESYKNSFGEHVSGEQSAWWVSDDAETWIEIDAPREVNDLAAPATPGLFALGGGMNADLWYTPDLVTWEIVAGHSVGTEFVMPTPVLDGYIGVQDVAPDGSGDFWLSVSADAKDWRSTASLPPGRLGNHLEVFSDGRLLAGLVEPGSGSLDWQLWLWAVNP